LRLPGWTFETDAQVRPEGRYLRGEELGEIVAAEPQKPRGQRMSQAIVGTAPDLKRTQTQKLQSHNFLPTHPYHAQEYNGSWCAPGGYARVRRSMVYGWHFSGRRRVEPSSLAQKKKIVEF